MWAWGWNGYGQLGDGSTVTRVVPTKVHGFVRARTVAAGFLQSFAVDNDRSLRGWGWNAFGQLGGGPTDPRLAPMPVHGVATARVVSAGALHSLSG